MEWLPVATATPVESACDYITHGLPIVIVHGVVEGGGCTCSKGKKCPKPGKHPVSGAWQKKVYETPEAFRDAVAAKGVPANFNIGIVMGSALDGRDLLAIDVDNFERLAELSLVLGELPSTLASRSGGGGSHRIFTLAPGQDAKRLKNRVGLRLATEPPTAGVDVRWRGGQIVVCPSLHESGERYSWSERLEIAELPEKWFEVIADEIDGAGGGGGSSGRGGRGRMPVGSNVVAFGDKYIERYVENLITKNAESIAGRGKGERNSVLWTKACTVFEHLAGARLPFSRALGQLTAAGIACGLPRAEVNETLLKAERHVRSTGATRTPGPLLRVGARGGAAGDPGAARAPSSSPAAGASEPGMGAGAAAEPAWELSLSRSGPGGSGAPKATLGNTCLVLRNDPWFRGRLSYNRMRITPCVDAAPLRDADLALWREQIEKRWGFAPGAETMASAVLLVSDETSFHPVQSYLEGLVWDPDAPSLIARVASEVLGIKEPDALTQRMLRCWFVSAVARVLKPGCKVDTSLVLAGDQGYKKSTFFEVLGGEWFSDSYVDVRTKDGILQVHAAWIYEWAEIDRVTTKVGSSDVKAFMTIRRDDVRPPYGRGVISQPRSSVIVGSTNKPFLDDETGARRFHPIQINQLVNVGLLRTWRDQLWAEAVAAYRAGEEWWLTRDEEVEREDAAAEHMVENPWLEKIELYLRHPARRITGVTTSEVLTGALGLDVAKVQRGEQTSAGKALRRLGWIAKQETRHGVRMRVHYHRDTILVLLSDEQLARGESHPGCAAPESVNTGPSQLALPTQLHPYVESNGGSAADAPECAPARVHTIPGALRNGVEVVHQVEQRPEIPIDRCTTSEGFTAEPEESDHE